ncbi:MAG: zinc transport system ATP-binding protein [Eubacteriaceae bacterium]|nr:zinc transport system ATP-binding protein [Eubacteriaceae bacterium]MDK2905929.1 zinc transport system ATP-binding protein [Eubacteriaceae bacterium]MDK2937437.1 zinc transport system ATP-binding protein [Eubacteriaceae bacterium]MDK2962455.1 zinc transport system ATP-binding protein [Eubacteriaceae bacterium]MDN5306917.1 zinc transport system ATP-binding protein [Eubacteriaceae bacterium]
MTKTAIHVEDLSVIYDQTVALEGVCLDVEEGEYLGIIGPNGGGKTTFLKALLGLTKISSGKIEIFGQCGQPFKAPLGYVPQFSGLNKAFPMTVEEVVLTGFISSAVKPFFKYSKAQKEAVKDFLQKVGMLNLAGRQIGSLSGGEFQRMLIARALAVRPKILFLDEPTASVDARSREDIYQLLKELNKEMTIILVTHDLLAISSHVGRLACLNSKLVYHGEPQLNEKIVTQLYGCPVDLIAHGVPHRVLKDHEGGCC